VVAAAANGDILPLVVFSGSVRARPWPDLDRGPTLDRRPVRSDRHALLVINRLVAVDCSRVGVLALPYTVGSAAGAPRSQALAIMVILISVVGILVTPARYTRLAVVGRAHLSG